MRRKLFVTLSALGLLLPGLSFAEIVHVGKPRDSACTASCDLRWPNLKVPPAWHQELAFSLANNLNFLVPDDESESVGIYGMAVEASRGAATLTDFIAQERTRFSASTSGVASQTSSGLIIRDGEAMTNLDGMSLTTLVFEPQLGGNWDTTVYAEDKDSDGRRYYITITLSAPTRAAREIFTPVLKQVIAGYHLDR